MANALARSQSPSMGPIYALWRYFHFIFGGRSLLSQILHELRCREWLAIPSDRAMATGTVVNGAICSAMQCPHFDHHVFCYCGFRFSWICGYIESMIDVFALKNCAETIRKGEKNSSFLESRPLSRVTFVLSSFETAESHSRLTESR